MEPTPITQQSDQKVFKTKEEVLSDLNETPGWKTQYQPETAVTGQEDSSQLTEEEKKSKAQKRIGLKGQLALEKNAFLKRIMQDSMNQTLVDELKQAESEERAYKDPLKKIVARPKEMQEIPANRLPVVRKDGKAAAPEDRLVKKYKREYKDADYCTAREYKALTDLIASGNNVVFNEEAQNPSTQLKEIVDDILSFNMEMSIFTDDYLSEHITELFTHSLKLKKIPYLKTKYPRYFESLPEDKKMLLELKLNTADAFQTALRAHLKLHGVTCNLSIEGDLTQVGLMGVIDHGTQTKRVREQNRSDYDRALQSLKEKINSDDVIETSAILTEKNLSYEVLLKDIEGKASLDTDMYRAFREEYRAAYGEIKRASMLREDYAQQLRELKDKYSSAKEIDKGEIRANMRVLNGRILMTGGHIERYMSFIRFLNGEAETVPDETREFMELEGQTGIVEAIDLILTLEKNQEKDVFLRDFVKATKLESMPKVPAAGTGEKNDSAEEKPVTTGGTNEAEGKKKETEEEKHEETTTPEVLYGDDYESPYEEDDMKTMAESFFTEQTVNLIVKGILKEGRIPADLQNTVDLFQAHMPDKVLGTIAAAYNAVDTEAAEKRYLAGRIFTDMLIDQIADTLKKYKTIDGVYEQPLETYWGYLPEKLAKVLKEAQWKPEGVDQDEPLIPYPSELPPVEDQAQVEGSKKVIPKKTVPEAATPVTGGQVKQDKPVEGEEKSTDAEVHAEIVSSDTVSAAAAAGVDDPEPQTEEDKKKKEAKTRISGDLEKKLYFYLRNDNKNGLKDEDIALLIEYENYLPEKLKDAYDQWKIITTEDKALVYTPEGKKRFEDLLRAEGIEVPASLDRVGAIREAMSEPAYDSEGGLLGYDYKPDTKETVRQALDWLARYYRYQNDQKEGKPKSLKRVDIPLDADEHVEYEGYEKQNTTTNCWCCAGIAIFRRFLLMRNIHLKPEQEALLNQSTFRANVPDQKTLEELRAVFPDITDEAYKELEEAGKKFMGGDDIGSIIEAADFFFQFIPDFRINRMVFSVPGPMNQFNKTHELQENEKQDGAIVEFPITDRAGNKHIVRTRIKNYENKEVEILPNQWKEKEFKPTGCTLKKEGDKMILNLSYVEDKPADTKATDDIILNNQTAAFIKQVRDILHTGNLVAILTGKHYRTITGIKGREIKFLNSASSTPDVEETQDVSFFLNSTLDTGERVEITWISPLGSPGELKDEFSELSYDEAKEEFSAPLSQESAHNLFQTKGVSVGKTTVELGDGMDRISYSAYIPKSVKKTVAPASSTASPAAPVSKNASAGPGVTVSTAKKEEGEKKKEAGEEEKKEAEAEEKKQADEDLSEDWSVVDKAELEGEIKKLQDEIDAELKKAVKKAKPLKMTTEEAIEQARDYTLYPLDDGYAELILEREKEESYKKKKKADREKAAIDRGEYSRYITDDDPKKLAEPALKMYLEELKARKKKKIPAITGEEFDQKEHMKVAIHIQNIFYVMRHRDELKGQIEELLVRKSKDVMDEVYMEQLKILYDVENEALDTWFLANKGRQVGLGYAKDSEKSVTDKEAKQARAHLPYAIERYKFMVDHFDRLLVEKLEARMEKSRAKEKKEDKDSEEVTEKIDEIRQYIQEHPVEYRKNKKKIDQVLTYYVERIRKLDEYDSRFSRLQTGIDAYRGRDEYSEKLGFGLARMKRQSEISTKILEFQASSALSLIKYLTGGEVADPLYEKHIRETWKVDVTGMGGK